MTWVSTIVLQREGKDGEVPIVHGMMSCNDYAEKWVMEVLLANLWNMEHLENKSRIPVNVRYGLWCVLSPSFSIPLCPTARDVPLVVP